ncbi:MAG: glycosyltransferase, partial [Bacteroidales bacterium]
SNPLINEIYSYLYRRRINNVSRIFTVQSDCIWSARILGQGNKIDLFPFLVDTKNIKNNINYGLLEKLKMKYGKYDLLFFNPTRKNMEKGKVDYKGSEKLLEAFKKFQVQTKRNVKMIAGLQGEHAEMFKKMVDSCNLKEYVDYTGHLSLPELHAYMSLDNVVTFDQFTINLNTLGGIQREALALGSIIVSSTDVHTKEFTESYGEGCPLMPAFSDKQILMQMEKLAGMTKEEFYRLSYSAVEWADKYIHWESRIDELIEKLEGLKS